MTLTPSQTIASEWFSGWLESYNAGLPRERVALITGDRRSGKTALAAHLAQRYLDDSHANRVIVVCRSIFIFDEFEQAVSRPGRLLFPDPDSPDPLRDVSGFVVVLDAERLSSEEIEGLLAAIGDKGGLAILVVNPSLFGPIPDWVRQMKRRLGEWNPSEGRVFCLSEQVVEPDESYRILSAPERWDVDTSINSDPILSLTMGAAEWEIQHGRPPSQVRIPTAPWRWLRIHRSALIRLIKFSPSLFTLQWRGARFDWNGWPLSLERRVERLLGWPVGTILVGGPGSTVKIGDGKEWYELRGVIDETRGW